MKLHVKLDDGQEFDLNVGNGRQTIKWLALAVARRAKMGKMIHGSPRHREGKSFNGTEYRVSHIHAASTMPSVATIGQQTSDGSLRPELIINQVLQDEDTILVNFLRSKRPDAANQVMTTAWQQQAYDASSEVSQTNLGKFSSKGVLITARDKLHRKSINVSTDKHKLSKTRPVNLQQTSLHGQDQNQYGLEQSLSPIHLTSPMNSSTSDQNDLEESQIERIKSEMQLLDAMKCSPERKKSLLGQLEWVSSANHVQQKSDTFNKNNWDSSKVSPKHTSGNSHGHSKVNRNMNGSTEHLGHSRVNIDMNESTEQIQTAYDIAKSGWSEMYVPVYRIQSKQSKVSLHSIIDEHCIACFNLFRHYSVTLGVNGSRIVSGEAPFTMHLEDLRLFLQESGILTRNNVRYFRISTLVQRIMALRSASLSSIQKNHSTSYQQTKSDLNQPISQPGSSPIVHRTGQDSFDRINKLRGNWNESFRSQASWHDTEDTEKSTLLTFPMFLDILCELAAVDTTLRKLAEFRKNANVNDESFSSGVGGPNYTDSKLKSELNTRTDETIHSSKKMSTQKESECIGQTNSISQVEYQSAARALFSDGIRLHELNKWPPFTPNMLEELIYRVILPRAVKTGSSKGIRKYICQTSVCSRISKYRTALKLAFWAISQIDVHDKTNSNNDLVTIMSKFQSPGANKNNSSNTRKKNMYEHSSRHTTGQKALHTLKRLSHAAHGAARLRNMSNNRNKLLATNDFIGLQMSFLQFQYLLLRCGLLSKSNAMHINTNEMPRGPVGVPEADMNRRENLEMKVLPLRKEISYPNENQSSKSKQSFNGSDDGTDNGTDNGTDTGTDTGTDRRTSSYPHRTSTPLLYDVDNGRELLFDDVALAFLMASTTDEMSLGFPETVLYTMVFGTPMPAELSYSKTRVANTDATESRSVSSISPTEKLDAVYRLAVETSTRHWRDMDQSYWRSIFRKKVLEDSIHLSISEFIEALVRVALAKFEDTEIPLPEKASRIFDAIEVSISSSLELKMT